MGRFYYQHLEAIFNAFKKKHYISCFCTCPLSDSWPRILYVSNFNWLKQWNPLMSKNLPESVKMLQMTFIPNENGIRITFWTKNNSSSLFWMNSSIVQYKTSTNASTSLTFMLCSGNLAPRLFFLLLYPLLTGPDKKLYIRGWCLLM